MIIINIQAENILKYPAIHLQEIPESGIVAVSGENESGKSAIGEIICFLLFGRTFSLDSDQIRKVIRWGESHCSGTITFRQGENYYRLSRFLDKDGNHSAKLILSATEQVIASGVRSVEDVLRDVLGYHFDGFVSAFYLAQREITAPHPQSEIIKVMAGLDPLETVMQEIKTEITRETEEILSAEQQISETDVELRSISLDKAQLRVLRKQYTTDNDFLTELQRQITGLEQASYRYQETLPLITGMRVSWGVTRFLRNIVLLLVIVLAGSGLLCFWFSDHALSQWVIGLLYRFVQPNLVPPYATGVMVLLFLLLIADAILKWRMHRLEGERAALVTVLRKIYQTASAYPVEVATAHGVPTTDVRVIHLQTIESPADNDAYRILQQITDNAALPAQVEGIVSRALTWLNTLSGQYKKLVSSLDVAIADEERKLRAAQHLEDMARTLHAAISEHRHRIAVRHLAYDLLQGACGRMAQRFNRDVREAMSMILPMFTDNHYQYLRIDTEFNVQIFSMEKQDFMDLDEVSSGTQRQTMLALRIVLAQQLLDRTRRASQFLFLDEPFAFFDEVRTRHALAVLPKLGGSLKQIWIVAQSFPEYSKHSFARIIECPPLHGNSDANRSAT